MDKVHYELIDCGYIRPGEGGFNGGKLELSDCARQLPAGTKVVIEEKYRQLWDIERERIHLGPDPLSSDEELDDAFQAIRGQP